MTAISDGTETSTAASTSTAEVTSPDTPRTRGRWVSVDTPDGPFTVIVDDADAVLASGWTDDPSYLTALVHKGLRPGTLIDSDELGSIVDAVEAYYAGDLNAPSTIAVTQHSDGRFLGHAWEVLRTVAAGEPVTYTRFAELAGEPAAVRAAAMACARNAAALFVPCHRVLRSNGELGGFRYGLEIKQSLLDREAPPAQ